MKLKTGDLAYLSWRKERILILNEKFRSKEDKDWYWICTDLENGCQGTYEPYELIKAGIYDIKNILSDLKLKRTSLTRQLENIDKYETNLKLLLK